MHINLDTETLKPAEARGLIAFLSSLFPASEQLELTWTPQDPGSAAACIEAGRTGDVTAAGLLGHIQYADQLEPVADSTPINPPASVTNPTPINPPASVTEPTPINPPASVTDPTPINQPATRHRRTKAEIAADEAAAVAAAQASQAVAGSAAPAAAASGTTQSATVTPSTALVSADELRALLNGYIAKHSMEEAIGQLQNFGCNRVTEALALDTVKLAALAGALRG